jgi:hypothetical protein
MYGACKIPLSEITTTVVRTRTFMPWKHAMFLRSGLAHRTWQKFPRAFVSVVELSFRYHTVPAMFMDPSHVYGISARVFNKTANRSAPLGTLPALPNLIEEDLQSNASFSNKANHVALTFGTQLLSTRNSFSYFSLYIVIHTHDLILLCYVYLSRAVVDISEQKTRFCQLEFSSHSCDVRMVVHAGVVYAMCSTRISLEQVTF